MNRTIDLTFIQNLYGEVIVAFEQEIQSLSEKVISLEEENARLKELLQAQLDHRFGKSSERSDNQTGETTNGKQVSQTVTVAAHTRRKKTKGKLLSTEHLPRFQKTYDLEEHEKSCATCQGNLHLIKRSTTEQLEIIPCRYCVVEHIQLIYGCRSCNTVTTSPKPLAPLPKAIAGASMLADVVISKYQAHLPLYRQSKMMKQDGLLIPDNTLGNWVIKLGMALEPLYQAMWCILQQPYLQVDETPVKILEPNKKGYLWTYYAPHIGNKRGLVVFELSETRKGEIAEKRLQSFNGLLQTDGYFGYSGLRKREGIVPLGCFTHSRRKFKAVVKITGDQSGIAAQMLEKMKPLYELEARMKKMEVSFHTRKRLRQKIAKPITQEIYHWLKDVQPSVPPKSKLGEAIQYTLNQWPYLVAYLRHGMAEIDTNDVENKIRDIALGKKNWLFIGNKDSGVVHAIFYSLLISAILNDLNPRVYMHYITTKIHELRKGDIDPTSLLPHRIDIRILEEFAREQIAFAKKIFNPP
jgi:transposase